jgi:hypothetical protein
MTSGAVGEGISMLKLLMGCDKDEREPGLPGSVYAGTLKANIVITDVKNRWITPTDGGWCDAMITFYFADDVNQHICEIQLVHSQMMTVRKDLNAHKAYNVYRSAIELLEATRQSQSAPMKKLSNLNRKNTVDFMKQGFSFTPTSTPRATVAPAPAPAAPQPPVLQPNTHLGDARSKEGEALAQKSDKFKRIGTIASLQQFSFSSTNIVAEESNGSTSAPPPPPPPVAGSAAAAADRKALQLLDDTEPGAAADSHSLQKSDKFQRVGTIASLQQFSFSSTANTETTTTNDGTAGDQTPVAALALEKKASMKAMAALLGGELRLDVAEEAKAADSSDQGEIMCCDDDATILPPSSGAPTVPVPAWRSNSESLFGEEDSEDEDDYAVGTVTDLLASQSEDDEDENDDQTTSEGALHDYANAPKGVQVQASPAPVEEVEEGGYMMVDPDTDEHSEDEEHDYQNITKSGQVKHDYENAAKGGKGVLASETKAPPVPVRDSSSEDDEHDYMNTTLTSKKLDTDGVESGASLSKTMRMDEDEYDLCADGDAAAAAAAMKPESNTASGSFQSDRAGMVPTEAIAGWPLSCIGIRVAVTECGNGTLRFIGENANGKARLGVELDEANGKNDGTVKGLEYFACAKKHGVLALTKHVRCLPEVGGDASSEAGGGRVSAGVERAPAVEHTPLDVNRVLLSGWFKKKADTKLGMSQVRWFELTQNSIRYFTKCDQETNLGVPNSYKGTIELFEQTSAVVKNESECQLRISQPDGRVWKLVPHRYDEPALQAQQWQFRINSEVRKQYSKQNSSGSSC